MYIEENDLPYFMKNKDWYYFDYDERLYKPTDKAPEKARKSINKFNAENTGIDENGNRWSAF